MWLSFSTESDLCSISSTSYYCNRGCAVQCLKMFLLFCLKVLRGHMQSVISVLFIESRGQLISLSKDKVSYQLLSCPESTNDNKKAQWAS